MKTETCSKCGSNKIIHNTKIVDFDHGNAKKDLSVQIKTTDNTFFNTFERGQLKADICGSCGHTELSVNKPHELWQAHLKAKSL